MEPTVDVERGAWLRARAGAWATVGGVAGTGFEAYARILHPVQAWRTDPTITDEWGSPLIVEDTRWGWAEVARRNARTMHPLVQWFSLTDREERREWPDGWAVGQAEEGRLPAELLAALTGPLARNTRTPELLTAAFWIGWGELHDGAHMTLVLMAEGGDPEAVARERARVEAELREERRRAIAPAVREAIDRGPFFDWPGREMLLCSTSLGELADPTWPAHAGVAGLTPQLLWPADRRWVVASEIDWDSTIVAGSRALIDEVLADEAFESYEVDEASDLTWDGDTINPRPPGRRDSESG